MTSNSKHDSECAAKYWSAAEDGSVRCGLCPHRCHIAENAQGLCGARENCDGELIASGYGVVSSVALDPIEKKPLHMFSPGKNIVSIGGFGCNLRCMFCQNHEIASQWSSVRRREERIGRQEKEIGRPNAEAAGGARDREGRRLTPEDVVALAVQTVADGNVGVAYTYNEPLIGYEFVYDCAELVRGAGLKNALVTNGYINEEPLADVLPLIDAMNIDLKAYTNGFYNDVGGNLETVKRTIELAQKSCHVEVTTLVIPGENDGDIEGIARWLASVDSNIPLHLSRFFPRYRYSDREPTSRAMILDLQEKAKKHLANVFAGNM